jgi:alcohol dehydrogenase class IV
VKIDEALIREIVLRVVENRLTQGQAQAAPSQVPPEAEPGRAEFLAAEQTCPVIFGAGALHTVGRKALELGCRKVLLVSDPGLVKLGLARRVADNLRASGVASVLFDRVQPNPLDADCNAGGEIARREKVDGVVAVGGGSVMDSGKAIKVLTGNPPPISKYYGAAACERGAPLILIPTTAGTGSESTKYAVLTDAKTHEKKVALATGDLAICDPELTYRLPKGLTAATGVDVLAHACESYAGGVHNPKADLLARAAIGKIAVWLPKAYRGENNETARYEVMLACSFAGMAFNETLCHLGHAAAHSIGAVFNIPHGICCAWTLPETMAFCAALYPERVAVIAAALQLEPRPGIAVAELGQLTADGIRALLRQLEIKSPRESGIERDDFLAVAGLVRKDFCYPVIPVSLSEAEIREFLGRAYDSYQ